MGRISHYRGNNLLNNFFYLGLLISHEGGSEAAMRYCDVACFSVFYENAGSYRPTYVQTPMCDTSSPALS